jgi:hypothetical protein
VHLGSHCAKARVKSPAESWLARMGPGLVAVVRPRPKMVLPEWLTWRRTASWYGWEKTLVLSFFSGELSCPPLRLILLSG